MVDLWSVVIGGGLTIGGIVINQWSQWKIGDLTRKDSRQQSRSDKFEALVEAFYDFDQWLGELRNHKLWSPDTPLRANPLPKAQTLALVHFPGIASIIQEYEAAHSSYTSWIYTAASKKLDGDRNFCDGFDAEIKKYINCRAVFFQKLRDFGQRTFH